MNGKVSIYQVSKKTLTILDSKYTRVKNVPFFFFSSRIFVLKAIYLLMLILLAKLTISLEVRFLGLKMLSISFKLFFLSYMDLPLPLLSFWCAFIPYSKVEPWETKLTICIFPFFMPFSTWLTMEINSLIVHLPFWVL